MTRRLRIPAVLAVTVVGAIAGVSSIGTSGCEGGSRPLDAAQTDANCFEGVCVADPNHDAGVCEHPGACASNFMCPPGCLVV